MRQRSAAGCSQSTKVRRTEVPWQGLLIYGYCGEGRSKKKEGGRCRLRQLTSPSGVLHGALGRAGEQLPGDAQRLLRRFPKLKGRIGPRLLEVTGHFTGKLRGKGFPLCRLLKEDKRREGLSVDISRFKDFEHLLSQQLDVREAPSLEVEKSEVFN